MTEIQSSVRLLALLAHYELGNESLLECSIINTKRYQLSRKSLFKVEKSLLSFMRKLINAPIKERSVIFGEMQKKIGQLAQDPKESRAFNNFDFRVWVRANLEGIHL